MAIELQTRIALKYDSYANWTNDTVADKGANLVLLAGELGICEIAAANQASNVAPTVLFKVGNGTDKFSELPWASATAADVYGWAKAKTVSYDTTAQKISFKDADNKEIHAIDLSTLATKAAVKETTDDLAARLTDVEAALGLEGDGEDGTSVSAQIKGLGDRLDVIEGDAETEGSIEKAAADTLSAAQTYAAEKAETAETNAKTYAKDYTDEALEAFSDHGARITAAEAAISKEVSDREAAISAIDTAYKAVDKEINDKIGAGFDATNTVAKAIEDAITTAGNNAQSKVDALANGAVNTNTEAIAELRADLTQEATDRATADQTLSGRLESVEAFFKTTEGETLDTALDTLKEIQDYLNGEGDATGGLLSRVADAEDAIEDLQDIVAKETTGLVDRVAAAEAGLTNAKATIEDLTAVTGGYSGENAIKTAVDAAKTQADKGVENAGKAQSAADAAQADVDALTAVIEHAETGLGAVKTIADDNASAIAGLSPRVTAAEGAITALEATVNTGDNSNTKLRNDITSLQQLTGDTAKGNEQLRTELTALQGVVNDTTTGLEVTNATAVSAKTTAEGNTSRIAAIEGDYLKAADTYIFNCGSATTIVHTETATETE